MFLSLGTYEKLRLPSSRHVRYWQSTPQGLFVLDILGTIHINAYIHPTFDPNIYYSRLLYIHNLSNA